MTNAFLRSIALFSLSLTLTSTLAAQAPAEKAWTVLNEGLSNKDMDDREVAVRLLGTLQGDPKATDLALKAFDDEKSDIRAAAADALTGLKVPSTIPKLTEVADKDDDPAVVIAAARALVAMNDPTGYDIFFAILTGQRKSNEGMVESQKKMFQDPKKLAKFSFEQGINFVPFGGLGLNIVRTLTKDSVSPVRAGAARVLSNDPDTKTLAALENATHDDSWLVRAAAIDAIRLNHDESVLPILQLRLDDEKPEVRYAAAAAIIHMHDEASAKPQPAKTTTSPKAKAKKTTK
ncbi:MAG TPA: HEAT repeat domain-containing protein [Edaphobacter sp.]